MNETNKPPRLSIQLTVDQINVVLATMGKLPYETIAPLMNSIQYQASQQLAELQAAAPAAPEDATNLQ